MNLLVASMLKFASLSSFTFYPGVGMFSDEADLDAFDFDFDEESDSEEDSSENDDDPE